MNFPMVFSLRRGILLLLLSILLGFFVFELKGFASCSFVRTSGKLPFPNFALLFLPIVVLGGWLNSYGIDKANIVLMAIGWLVMVASLLCVGMPLISFFAQWV